MMPLWASCGGGSQLRRMVSFCSWLTVTETVCGGALGTAGKEISSLLFYKMIILQVNEAQTVWWYQSLALWGDVCCSPSRTSCRRKGELWTRTCSLSTRGPSEPGNWAVRPCSPPSQRWQAGESGTEPQSHPGNEAETGGTEAKWGTKTQVTHLTPQTHTVDCLSLRSTTGSYLPLDLGHVGSRSHHRDTLQRNSKGWKLFVKIFLLTACSLWTYREKKHLFKTFSLDVFRKKSFIRSKAIKLLLPLDVWRRRL